MGVVSDDSRYNGVDPDDVLLINKDDSDKAGITVTPYRGLVTTEAGAKDSFSVKLESEPVADLTIALDKTKLSEGSLSSDTLIFTPANWGTLQQVIVTGLNDLVVDGDRTYKIITRKPVSDDSLYTTINPDDIIVTNHAREPIMVVPVDSLDFGLVARDGYNVKTFDVVNAGTDTLRVSDGTINSQAFIASATEFKVAPRDTFQVYIQFLGESAIYYAALFKAKHNDTSRGDLKIKLKGEAFKPTIAAVDTVVDFGMVYVFFDEERELSVYNAGNSDLRIDSLVTSGDQFSVSPLYTLLLPMYLKPSDSTSVTVIFSSPDSGEARENLRIFSNDQDRPRFDVPIVATILPPDTVGPSFEIISITPEEALLKQFISVETELKDATEVEEAVLYFLEGGQTEFTAYPMITEDQETFEFVSRPADVTMNGIAFYMLARDQRGNFALSDTFSPPVKFRDGSLQTTLPNSAYGDGVPKKKWRLISVPAELEDPNVVNTLGDELDGKPNSRKWRIFEPENSGGGGSGWKKPEELSVGKGYWLIQAIDERAVLSTGAGKTISLTGYDMTLEPGWNMISSPYAFPMTPNLDGASFYGPLTYGNGSEGWSEESTMLPWSGYLIYNRLSEVKTVQLAPLDFSSESNTQTLARERSDGEWMLQFKAEGANYSDTGNILGRKIDAEEGLDHFDNPEPPYMDKFVSVTLEPDNPFFKKHSMTSDIRSSFVKDGIWNVALHTRGEKGPIEVSHDLFGAFPSEDAMVMLDMTTRNQYNLLEEQKVEIIDYSEDFPYR
ncbi:MAG TPA: choice-of-anchor D domain-containing protein, partial [Candidatus Marinimicrobia bacterium]|nr:choice-of-anchor D domain-containing protein [Candidatus Neomarinimicrobiota bacterium]